MKQLRILIFISLFFTLPGIVSGKTKVIFSPVDSFNRETPDSLTAVLSDNSGATVDSIFIPEFIVTMSSGARQRIKKATLSFEIKNPGNYELMVKAAGRTPKNIKFEVAADEKEKNLGVIELDKIIELGEVKVVASKVKMVMKGDTIVYNADAFNLAKGSMLDRLIAMLPGAAINDKGQITVNGEFVSSLLINGKDFFKGNPSVALQNIPYYTVNQVKVYRKEGLDAYLRERTEAEKKNDPLVMDVVMKEKFLGTYIGHADVAGGTERRYSLRVFLGGFGKRHNMAVYGNLNNVGANSNPSKDAWIWENGMAGIFDNVYRSAGLTYNYQSDDGKKNVRFNADGSSTSHNNDYLTASTAYFPGDYSTASRSTGSYHSTNGHFNSYLNGTLQLKKAVLSFQTSLYFSHNRGRTGHVSGTHRGDEYLDTISITNPDFINRLFMRTRTKSTDLNIHAAPYVNFKLPVTGDLMTFTVSVTHAESRSESMDVSHNITRTSTDILNRFIKNPGHNDRFLFRTGTGHWFKGGAKIGVGYELEYTDRKNRRALSHFLPDSVMTELPVVTDRLTMVTDLRQSFTATTRTLTNRAEVSGFFSAGNVGFDFRAPFNWIRDRFTDTRAPSISRNTFTVNPSLGISWKFLRFGYSLYNFTPTAEQLLDFTDDSDLMTIRKGNPDLRNQLRHTFSATFSQMLPKRNMNYSLSAGFTEFRRKVANALSYNPDNGVSTITAYNVGGNRDGYVRASFGKEFGYLKRFSLRTNVNGRMERSVAFASTGTPDFALSVVHSMNITPDLSLTYSRERYSVTATGSVTRYQTRGNLESFVKSDAWSGGPTISGWVRLPYDFQIESSVSNTFRTGYADPEMNRSYVYWNASLLKTLGRRGEWSLRLDAVDILGQVSSVSRSVNAQGITETRNSVIGRYFLLHLQYHFNFPKKK